MNFIDNILQRLDTMSADDIIQEIGGNIYGANIERNEILKYPQFVQDIIFLVDMDTELNMQGDILANSTRLYISNMVIALKNIHADNQAILLQNIFDTYNSIQNGEDEDKMEEIIDGLYNEMYFHTGFNIWSLLESYVEHEKENNKN